MATYWLANGVPVKVVSERLGHANISITLQIYGHVLPGMQAETAAKMDAWLMDGVTTSGEKPGDGWSLLKPADAKNPTNHAVF